MEQLLTEYPVKVEIPVAWGEMDAFQHVNNIIYFRYFESVRIVFFEKIGFIDCMNEIGIGPILASTQCKYIKPVRYPDTVTVGARVARIEDDRFDIHYLLVSHKLQKVAAEGDSLVVAYDYHNNKKALLPEEVEEGIRSL